MTAPAVTFTVLLEQDEDGWVAWIPALGIADDGDTREQVLEYIREDAKCYMEALEIEGLPIPTGDPPGPWIPPWEGDPNVKPGIRQTIRITISRDRVAA